MNVPRRSLRGNRLKHKLRKREFTVGSWITIGHEVIAELMSSMAFDWLVVDMEHSAIDLSDAQRLVRIIELNGCAPLIRVADNNPALIKRAMDTGAHGVIVPLVNTKEDAQQAVAAVKYPPVGTRGVGLARAQGYGTAFEPYRKWVNESSVVIVQIEHIEAVENFKEILSVEGVDGFLIGPYDLSGSVGKPGQFDDFLVRKNLLKVMVMARRMNVNAGIHVIPPDYKEVIARKNEGYRFIAFSLDTLLFSHFCQSSLDKILKGKRTR